MTVIVVGSGINGVTSAIELEKRGHDVSLLDPGPLPHPLAASTDVSKAVRGAYGPDETYTELAERCVPVWRDWNERFGAKLYHEVGFLFLRPEAVREGDFEWETARVFERRGHRFERIDRALIRERYPAWSYSGYSVGLLEIEAGYVEARKVVSCLMQEAKSLGVKLREGSAVAQLKEDNGRVGGVVLRDGTELRADATLVASGAWTPYLLPFANGFLHSTGHVVFHLRPDQPELFAPERFPVFGADIAATGYYGFPLNSDGVVKIGNHGLGREVRPGEADERAIANEDEPRLREFLAANLPALARAPIVFSRVCMYCDTNDGDFWIASDPDRAGLTIAAGDNGHGFKFAPVLGELIADAVEGKSNPFLRKFRWRPEVRRGSDKEAARSPGGL